jgi:hypothetical protein
MRRIFRGIRQTIILALMIMLLGVNSARACPNCKEAVSLGAGEAANVSNGYNWSVIFMISVPFSMMGMGAFAVHRAVKRGVLPEM